MFSKKLKTKEAYENRKANSDWVMFGTIMIALFNYTMKSCEIYVMFLHALRCFYKGRNFEV